MLSGIGKDAGATAAAEIHQAVDDVATKVAPALGEQVQAAEAQGVLGATGLIADVANRLQGAELPVDITITIRISGKIGALKLNNPEATTPPQTVEVSG